MRSRWQNRRSIVRLLGWLVVSTGFVAPPVTVYGQDPPMVRIGVQCDQSCQEKRIWKPFEDYLNDQLVDRKAKYKFAFRLGDMDRHLKDLRDGALDGAILSPFRYIVADVGIDDLEVVAQLRRGESVELAPGKQPWEEDFTEPKPRASYHGVIVMRLQAGVWPPKPDRPVVFAYPNTKSTSGFIYPRSLFKERGFIDSGAVKFFPPLQEGELSRLWEIASSGQVGSKDSKGLLDELEQGTEAFDLVGTNNSHYQGYLSEEERKRFVVVHTSDPIPFDAFVIRRTPESVLNPDNERQVELLREALLSTQSLSRAARQKVFPWFQENGSGAENSRLDRFRRYPDIFDWIDSSNEAYDSVRRVAVRTTGGTIVRLGISEYVHRQIKEDTSRYFNDIKRRLLKGSTTEAMRAQDRVFLDVIIYPKDRLSEMEKDLRSGALDLAELPAALAMQMVGEGHSVFATSLFVSPDAPSEIASYHYQIWTRRTDTARDQISDQFRFAHTTRESLSGFRMPFHDLKNEGLVDLENLREDQLVACGSAAGVFKALIDDEADYGFIADFERKYLDYIFSENDRAKVEPLPPHKKIPNAKLLMSKQFCPSFVDYRLLSAPKKRSFGDWLVDLLFGRDTVNVPPFQNRDAVKALQRAMEVRADAREGFVGYQPADQDDWNTLHAMYKDFYPSPAPLFVFAALAVFMASAATILYKQHPVGPTAIVVSDERAREVLARAVDFARNLSDSSKKFADAFGGKRKLNLIRKCLTERIGSVYSLFNPKTGKMIDPEAKAEYHKELDELSKYLENDIRAPLKKYEMELLPDGPKPGEQHWVNAALKAVDQIIEILKIIRP